MSRPVERHDRPTRCGINQAWRKRYAPVPGAESIVRSGPGAFSGLRTAVCRGASVIRFSVGRREDFYRNRVRRPVLFPGAAYDATRREVARRVERGGSRLLVASRQLWLAMARWLAARTGTTAENSAAISQRPAWPRFDRALDLRVATPTGCGAVPGTPNCLRLPFLGLARGEGTELDPAYPETDTVFGGRFAVRLFDPVNQDINVTLGQIRSETEPFKIT